MTLTFKLRPVDTLFFRDGTPFSAQADAQADVGSVFPPPPSTVSGALRVAFGRANGWSGHKKWSTELKKVLGDGPHDLGTFSMQGPFVLKKIHGKDLPLFRLPRHILGKQEADAKGEMRFVSKAFLAPGAPLLCDLGTVQLPALSAQITDPHLLKVGDDLWVSITGLQKIAAGTLPDEGDLFASEDLWVPEHRIGLERDPKSRTALEGQLYSTHHMRLKDDVSLGVFVQGIAADWNMPAEVMALGGESRMAGCERIELSSECDFLLKAPSQKLPSVEDNFVLIALSPLDLGAACGSGLGVPHAEDDLTLTGSSATGSSATGKAKVVSACVDRAERIGGWDSHARAPLAMRNILPAGSVLFCKGQAAANLVYIGERHSTGFGLCAVAPWPKDS